MNEAKQKLMEILPETEQCKHELLEKVHQSEDVTLCGNGR